MAAECRARFLTWEVESFVCVGRNHGAQFFVVEHVDRQGVVLAVSVAVVARGIRLHQIGIPILVDDGELQLGVIYVHTILIFVIF